MARKIRFALNMNNTEIRTLEELKDNFNFEEVLKYYQDDRLYNWLNDRYYPEKAEEIKKLSFEMKDFKERFCDILEVPCPESGDVYELEYIKRRNEKIDIISNISSDSNLIDNIDSVALDQNDLFDVLDSESKIAYLYKSKFSIPIGKKDICYIGIESPTVRLENGKSVMDYSNAGITFENVNFELESNPYYTKGEELFINNKFLEAITELKKDTNSENPRTLYILAMCYKDALWVNQNYEKTKELLSIAKQYKEPLSMINYAYHCLTKDSEEEHQIINNYVPVLKAMSDSGDVLAQFEYAAYLVDFSSEKTKGFEIMIKLAENGFALAQNDIGRMYEKGYIVDKDNQKAFSWYEKAAIYDYGLAWKNLAYMYRKGLGIEKDVFKAKEYYYKAALNNVRGAKFSFAELYLTKEYPYSEKEFEDIFNQLIEWVKDDAQKEVKRAMYWLGFIYRSRYEYDFENKDKYDEGREWILKAANAGISLAQVEMGKICHEEDVDSEAVMWYTKASEKGNAEAMFNLGNMYYYGKGVRCDEKKGFDLYWEAAERGFPDALLSLAHDYQFGLSSVCEKDLNVAIELYNRVLELDCDSYSKEQAQSHLESIKKDHPELF